MLLHGDQPEAKESSRVRLLRDAKAVFDHLGGDRLSTEQLLVALVNGDTPGVEGPWAEFWARDVLWEEDGRRTRLTSPGSQLARKLRQFEIKPQTIRIGADTPKGYKRQDFLDAWNRYLGMSDEPEARPSEDTDPAFQSSLA